jgi:DNA-directed RNA polymerase subunit K/omega
MEEPLEITLRQMDDPYARVVATAREARRINTMMNALGGAADETEKVTTKAMRHMVNGEVDWEFGPRKEPAEKLEAETSED